MKWGSILCLILGVSWCWSPPVAYLATGPADPVSGVVPTDAAVVLRQATRLSAMSPEVQLQPVTLVLSPRDEVELFHRLAELQTPGSPHYHQWLTPEEFGARFGRTEVEYQQLIDWLEAQDLEVVATWPNRLQLTVVGSVEVIERAFRVTMNFYQLGDLEGYAADREASLPVSLAPLVQGIVGLQNFPRVEAVQQPAAPGNILGPADLATVYRLKPLFDKGLDGTGTTIAIVARADFSLDDVRQFRRQFGLPPKEVSKVFPFGPITNPDPLDMVEALVDCEWAGAAAPDAEITAVIAPELYLSVQSIVNDLPQAQCISLSFAGCELLNARPLADLFQALFAQAAAQGQTVFVASGNFGAVPCIPLGVPPEPSVNFLAASPLVTAVGGTNVLVRYDEAGNAIRADHETGWSNSGGGDSRYFSKPLYQAGLGVPDNEARNLPDVSLLAGSPGYVYVISGNIGLIGGTSIATPCWAGICAILNEAQAASGGLGNINQELYRLGNAQARNQGPKVFTDILVGNNGQGGVRGFDAQPGYDRVSGWGSFLADALVEQFGRSPAAETVLPVISVLTPTAGDSIESQQTIQVRWQSSDNFALMRHTIRLSSDGGKTFPTVVAAGLAGTAQTFDWQTPPTTDARLDLQLAVTAVDTSFNQSTALSSVFSVTPDRTAPEVTVLSPQAGANIKLFASHTIEWTASDNIALQAFDLSYIQAENGMVVELAAGLPGTARSFDWSPNLGFPLAASSVIRVRATDINHNTREALSDSFALTNDPPPLVQVISPTDLQEITIGQTTTIRWEVFQTAEPLAAIHLQLIDFKTDESREIVTGLPGDSRSFDWTPVTDVVPTRSAIIKLTASDISGSTRSFFSRGFILEADTTPPEVKVLSPNGGEKLKTGKHATVSWVSSDDAGIARQDLFLSLDSGATYPIRLATGLPATAQSFVLEKNTIPTKSKSARLRVIATDHSGNEGQDESDGDFQIKGK